MADIEDIVARVRKDLGDLGTPFRQMFRGDGSTKSFDLPGQRIATLAVSSIVGSTITDLDSPDDYALDAEYGILNMVTAPAEDEALLAEGKTYGLFTDAEIEEFVHDATLQHCDSRTVTDRYKDDHGFIRYEDTPMDLDNLPEVEEQLVAFLATIEALWSLSTDASLDIDIQTADGTVVNRSQRYNQIRAQIALLTEKYETLSSQLNVGLFRIEVTNLRRVSRTNNRLVPIFKAREYDDISLPERMLPPIDQRHVDESGIPSPAVSGGYW